jgi:hypothetical protein
LPAFFFAAFVVAMAAMRVLIAWFCEHTQSMALAQLIHISFAGAPVVSSPPAVKLWALVVLLLLVTPTANSPRNS